MLYLFVCLFIFTEEEGALKATASRKVRGQPGSSQPDTPHQSLHSSVRRNENKNATMAVSQLLHTI